MMKEERGEGWVADVWDGNYTEQGARLHEGSRGGQVVENSTQVVPSAAHHLVTGLWLCFFLNSGAFCTAPFLRHPGHVLSVIWKACGLTCLLRAPSVILLKLFAFSRPLSFKLKTGDFKTTPCVSGK